MSKVVGLQFTSPPVNYTDSESSSVNPTSSIDSGGFRTALYSVIKSRGSRNIETACDEKRNTVTVNMPGRTKYRRTVGLKHLFTILLCCTFVAYPVLPRSSLWHFLKMRTLRTALLATWAVISSSVLAAKCDLHVVSSKPPSGGSSQVALQSYSYCGGNLNITVREPAPLAMMDRRH